MIYVSHRLPEVFRLCDAVSVLRDGKYVGTLKRDGQWPGRDQGQVIQMMIGRPVADYLPNTQPTPTAKPFSRSRTSQAPASFKTVSFDIHRRRDRGLCGIGRGGAQPGWPRPLFGLDAQAQGEVLLDGHPLKLGSIRRSMNRGIGLVPEDRKRQGLVLMMGGRQNFFVAAAGSALGHGPCSIRARTPPGGGISLSGCT